MQGMRGDMPNRSTVSRATSYQEIGEFWDTHDATDMGDDEPVEFDVHIVSSVTRSPSTYERDSTDAL